VDVFVDEQSGTVLRHLNRCSQPSGHTTETTEDPHRRCCQCWSRSSWNAGTHARVGWVARNPIWSSRDYSCRFAFPSRRLPLIPIRRANQVAVFLVH